MHMFKTREEKDRVYSALNAYKLTSRAIRVGLTYATDYYSCVAGTSRRSI